MKAEQRKELETNILADKMGRVVQRVKTSPRRTVTIYFVIAAVAALAIVFAFRWYRTSAQESAQLWMVFDDGSSDSIRSLANMDAESQVGKAARLQLAWIEYWDGGIKRLGVDPPGALKIIASAGERYSKLRADCKDDPVFEPQAMLGVAVCEEAKGIQDRLRLEKAITLYDELAKHEKYKDTAEGKFAQGRLDQLRDKNGKVRAEALNTYEDLQRVLRVPEIRLQPDNPFGPIGGQPPPDQPFFPPIEPKKKDK